MDEKKVNGNEFQPENAGTNPEPNNNTENINAKPEEQSTQNTTSGWVFSDKNVSGAQQNAEQSTQSSAGQMQDHPQKIRKEAHFSTTMLSRMNRVGTVPVQIHRQSRSLHTTAVIAMVSRQVNRVPMRTSRQIQNPAKAINGTMRITTSRHQSSQLIKIKRIKIKDLRYLPLSCAQSFVPV